MHCRYPNPSLCGGWPGLRLILPNIVRFYAVARLLHHSTHFMTKLPYRFLYGCISIALLWAAGSKGLAVAADGVPRHSLLAYTDENGLPQNAIHHLAYDQAGFLWLAMPEGLVRFDGHHFKIWNPEFSTLHLVAGNAPGSLYAVGAYGNVLSLRNGQTRFLCHTNIPLAGYRPELRALDYLPGKALPYAYNRNGYSYVMAAGEGRRYILTADSLKGLQNGTEIFAVSRRNEWLEPWRFFVLQGRLYYLYEKGAIREWGSPTHNRKPSGDLARDKNYGRSGAEIRPLVNTATGEVFMYLEDNLYAITANTEGELHSKHILTGFDFSDHAISSVAYDSLRGRVCLGSYTDGLFVFSRQSFNTLTFDEYMPDKQGNAYRAQIPYGQGRVLTSDGSILGLGQRAEYLQGFSDDADPNAFARDAAGNLWTKHIFEIDRWDSRMSRLLDAWRLPNTVSVLFADTDSNLWIGTQKPGSLYRLNLGEPEPQPQKWVDRLPDVTVIREEAQTGRLYLGTASGLYTVDIRTRKMYAWKGLEDKPIRTLYVDKNRPGEVWAASKGNGLFFGSKGTAKALPADHGNLLADTRCLLRDSIGNFWISTGKGLLWVASQDLLDFIHGKGDRVYYAYYGKSGGFKTNEFTGDCDPCGLALDNGYFSFPSLNGLVWFRPEEVQPEYPQAPIYSDGMRLNGALYPLEDSVNLPRDFKRLEIDYTTPYFGHAHNLVWETRMDDEEWQPAASGHILYTSLPPGTHELYIRKMSGPGIGRFDYRKLVLVVPPAYWQTAWFWIVCVLLGAGLVFLYTRLRVLYVKRQNRLLEEAIAERTQELKETIRALKESKDIISRDAELQKRLTATIAHDVKTPLKYLLLTADNLSKATPDGLKEEHETVKTVYHSLYRIYHFTDNLLAYIKTRFVDPVEQSGAAVNLWQLVQDKVDIFRDIAHAQHTQLENRVPTDIFWQGDANLLSVVIHNLVDNAVKFTFNGQIICTAQSTDSGIRITLTDTGVGIHPEQMEYIQQFLESDDDKWNPGYSKHSGMGLVIIKEIVKQLGGRLLMDSEQNMGTTVLLDLPGKV